MATRDIDRGRGHQTNLLLSGNLVHLALTDALLQDGVAIVGVGVVVVAAFNRRGARHGGRVMGSNTRGGIHVIEPGIALF